MTQITLPEPLFDRLQDVAKDEGIDVSKLLERGAENYLAHATGSSKFAAEAEKEWSWEEQKQIIGEEQKAYESQHETIYQNYAGQYIAMRKGELIDHDSDRVVLLLRVRSLFGNEPILITPVLPEPIQEIWVRGYRVQKVKP